MTAQDAYGNTATGYTGTVHFTSSDGSATLPANYTFLAGDAGVHSFSCGVTLKTAGSQSVTGTDTVTGTITGSQTVTVNPGSASALTIETAANGTGTVIGAKAVTAGSNFTGYAITRDTYGNFVANPSATWSLTGTTGGVTGTDLSPASGASSTFTGHLVGSAVVHAVVGTLTANSGTVTVNPGSATQLVLSGLSTQTAGTAQTLTVTAKDAYGNTATGYTGTVHFTSSDGSATLPANYTFVAGDAGVHSFSTGVTLKTAGSRQRDRHRHGDRHDHRLPDRHGQPGQRHHAGPQRPLRPDGGHRPDLTVTAQDAYGNTATGYTGTVHFTSSDGSATLPANYTFLAGDAGVHSFSCGVTLKTAGSQSVTGTDTVTGTITAPDRHGQPGQRHHAGPQRPLHPDGGHRPDLTRDRPGRLRQHRHRLHRHRALHLQRRFGHPAGQLHLLGRRRRRAQLQLRRHPEDRRLQERDRHRHGDRHDHGLQTVTVNPGSATKLALTGLSAQTAGTAQTLLVTAQDAYGNTATGYTGTVHFTSSDGSATLPANYTFLAGDAGVHSFASGVTLKTAGSQTVTGTDTVTGTISGSQTVTVNPGAATKLALSGLSIQPPNTAQSLTVTAQDAYGNTATGYTGTVHFTSSDGSATLPANYTFLAGDAGVHSFSSGVTLKTAGSRSVTGTDTVTGTITGSQTVWVLAVGTPYGGGVVGYIFQSGDPGYVAGQCHGLIAALTDQSSAAVWALSTPVNYQSTAVPGINDSADTAIGTGSANTTAIIAQNGAGTYAAGLAHAYTGGSYTDWYLPSKDELNKLYLNSAAINATAVANGGTAFAATYYWSSSEGDAWDAWLQHFGNGSVADFVKGLGTPPVSVRAVRSF